jgi:SulP family sulfate permease
MNKILNQVLPELKANWKSGLSVALVNIPMSLSLAIASGASPVAGIITAVWAGTVAAIFGGSRFNIIGPAGALSGILAGYSFIFGPAILPLIAIITGIMVLAIWALRWDRYIVFIPSSVIHGFTLSVAFVIGLGQINSALGLSGLTAHKELVANVKESLMHIGSTNLPAFILFAVGLALMFVMFKYWPKLPNSIIVALLGILVGAASAHHWIPFSFSTIQSKYGSLALSLFSMPHLSLDMFTSSVFKAVPLVAILVILETLLSAKVADGMTKTKFKQKKEVFAIGLANIVSGLFGGLPATGVFARTALNIRSGATSQWSALINNVGVVIISLALLPYFSYLPLPTVASILVYISFRMVSRQHFVSLYKFDKTSFGISLVVAFLCVWYDPLVGILFGSVISLLIFVNYLSKAQAEVVVGESEGEMKRLRVNDFNTEHSSTGDTFIYRFVGELNYMNAEKHKEFLSRYDGKHNVVLNFKNLFYVDLDGLEAIDEIMEDLETRGYHVFLSGISPYMEPYFSPKQWYEEKVTKAQVCANTKDALDRIKALAL